MNRIKYLLLLVTIQVGLVSIVSSPAFAARAIKTPVGITQEVMGIQDKFHSILEEECPGSACYSVGCVVGRFITLDQNQNSSLPGLETGNTTSARPQYKLASVRCEFAHEPGMDKKQIKQLRQRLKQRVKPVGVSVQIRAKKLDPKPEPIQLPEEAEPEPEQVVFETWEEGIKQSMVPMLPWLALLFSTLLFLLIAIWAYRRLGVKSAGYDDAIERSSDVAIIAPKVVDAEATPMMIMTRLTQMKAALELDSKLVEFTLRPYFEKENYAELCLFLKHFGPEFLSVFREKAEFRGALGTLSQVYNDSDNEESNVELWKYLDRLDRAIVSAKVKINNEPLEDEFAFLSSLGVDELLGLLKDCSDLESVAAISYAPQKLREKFFTVAPATLTSKIVMQLTKVDRMPDSFIRDTARKLRKHYNENAQHLKTVQVKKNPLIEIALNSLTEEDRKELILGLKKNSANALKELAPSIFLDETLLHIEDEMLTEVFLEVPPRDAASYLANFDWADEVIERLKPRVREPIRKFSRNPDLLDLGVMSSVRGKIADYVRKREAAGAVDLGSINEKLLGD